MTGDEKNALLSDDLLDHIRERAAIYDRENRFFTEDLEELRQAGYLAACVPEAFGGGGLTLTELTRLQRKLATASPATALGVNMHLVWAAVAKLMHERGDDRLNWVFDEIVSGEIFAFGISEPGNDAVLMDSASSAEPSANGYLVSGTKVFTTLAPVWTRLGVHAKVSDSEKLVFGFIRRDATGAPRDRSESSRGLSTGNISHVGEWNPLGMRATQSWNTVLEQVELKSADVATETEVFNGKDPVIFSIFVAFSTLTAAVYAGIADRAIALSRASANRSHTFADGSTAPLITDPDVATKLTNTVLQHRASIDALEMLTRDADELVDRDDWFIALGAARNRVTDEARDAVTEAMRLAGSRGFQADSELARMYRDVLAGLFHPTSARGLAATVRGVLTDET